MHLKKIYFKNGFNEEKIKEGKGKRNLFVFIYVQTGKFL